MLPSVGYFGDCAAECRLFWRLCCRVSVILAIVLLLLPQQQQRGGARRGLADAECRGVRQYTQAHAAAWAAAWR